MLVALLAFLTEFAIRLLLPALFLLGLGEWIKRNRDLFRNT
jgi:hypothetical protein